MVVERCHGSDLLREAVARAVAYGRTTREDAEGLAHNLVAIGRHQVRDAFDGLGGSSHAALVLARVRVANLGEAARRALRG